ncbi:MAG: hypothetical protein J2P46_05115 [Zavarzinella sp.]|nr:hypothetical protein [Zavarzinella sp.]
MSRKFPARALGALALGLAVVAAGGCGGPPRAHVRGTVTLDGQPLANGTVEFFPVGGDGQSAGAAIKDGAYEVEASVGEMRVTVYGSEVVGQRKTYDTPDSPVEDVVRNPIPARYNTQSELKATLVPGRNEVNFQLESGRTK